MAQRFSSIVVDVVKLRDYCLSEAHPRGRHKAKVFRSALGLGSDDAAALRQALLDAAYKPQAIFQPSTKDAYGERWILDFCMTTYAGSAMIRSTWIVRIGEDMLRLTSCYVL